MDEYINKIYGQILDSVNCPVSDTETIEIIKQIYQDGYDRLKKDMEKIITHDKYTACEIEDLITEMKLGDK